MRITGFLLLLALCVCSGCTSLLPDVGRYQVTDINPEFRATGAMISSCVLDTRAGMHANSGGSYSFSDRIRMCIPYVGLLASCYDAVDAGLGTTQRQWSYDGNFDRPGTREQLYLAQLLTKTGKMTPEQMERFQIAVMDRPGALDLEWAGIACQRSKETLPDRRWLTGRESEAWFSPSVMDALQSAGLVSRDDVRSVLSRIEYPEKITAPPNYYLLGEAIGLMDEAEVNIALKKRFWQLYAWALEDRRFTLKVRRALCDRTQLELSLESALAERMKGRCENEGR